VCGGACACARTANREARFGVHAYRGGDVGVMRGVRVELNRAHLGRGGSTALQHAGDTRAQARHEPVRVYLKLGLLVERLDRFPWVVQVDYVQRLLPACALRTTRCEHSQDKAEANNKRGWSLDLTSSHGKGRAREKRRGGSGREHVPAQARILAALVDGNRVDGGAIPHRDVLI
jgi:hypothetical protein